MTKNKGKKTTIVAVITTILGMSVFGMWYFDKIETSELMIALTSVGYLSNMLIGYLAKDKNESHSFDIKATGGELPIKDDEKVPA